MTIELIEKQTNTFCMKIDGRKYFFVPPKGMYDRLFNRIKPTVKGSTLGWNIKRTFISYNQLKQAIENNYVQKSLAI